MIYKHIYIKNFIPMLGCGTKSVDIDLTSNTLIVIGTNGCGKSSLFREITPYPANRPDYEKDGIRQVTIEHNGSTYVLTSDFSKAAKAHSFVKDGEELNESGTNATQTDLANTHFGMTEIIDNLINLKYHICDMGRADRKSLFMATYPNSMSFILEYHKNVCYQLRDFSANLKLLNERRMGLEEKVLKEAERKRIYGLYDKYQKLNNDIDQEIYALRQKIVTLRSMPDYNLDDGKEESSSLKLWVDGGADVDEFLKNMDSVVTHSLRVMAKLRKKNPWYQMNGTEGFRMAYKGLGMTSNNLDTNLGEDLREVKELKEQLDQYEQTKGIDLEKEIKILQEKLRNLEGMYAESKKVIEGKVFPKVASEDQLLEMNQGILGRIRYLLGEIFQETVIWTPEKVEKTKQQLWTWHIEIDNNEKHLNYLLNQVNGLKRQLSLVGNIDPACHSTICKLKEQVGAKLQETTKQIEGIVTEGKALRAKTEARKKEHDELEKELRGPLEVNEFVVKLIESIGQSGLSDYVCGGSWDVEKFIEGLNNNPSGIWDKLNSFTELNEHYLKCKGFEQDIKLTKQELDTMINIHLPAKNLIVKTISEKQLRYTKLLKEIEREREGIKTCRERQTVLDDMIAEDNELDYCARQLTRFCKWYNIDVQVKEAEARIRFFEEGKSKIQSNLFELDSVIKDQEAIRIRLTEEVLPQITALEKDYREWSSVEKALNPNNGIPHEYMVSYINALIEIANKIIKSVWVYDMEILPLNKENALTYGFSFTVNNGEPIKDIELASKGQKEIMDLAWILAIYHQMKLGKNYPLKLDEPDGGLNNEHRVRLLGFLTDMMRNGDLKQLFMINQFPSVYDTFVDSQTLCIKEEGIILPNEYNQNITIEHG